MVTVDGENRSGVTIWMVVVGPSDEQVEVRVAVLLGVGVAFGRGVVGGFAVAAALAEAVGAVGALVCRLLRAAGADCAVVGVDVAEVVAIGGACDPCTKTLPDPLLHAVTASIRPSPAATVP